MPLTNTPTPPQRVQNRLAFIEYAMYDRRKHLQIKLYPLLRGFVLTQFKEVPERIPEHVFKSYLTELFGPVTGHWLYGNMYEAIPVERFTIVMTEATDNREDPPLDFTYKPETPDTPIRFSKDITTDQVYARELKRELHKSWREDFATYLEARRGPVNGVNLYKQWMKTIIKKPAHARWRIDALDRIGSQGVRLLEESKLIQRYTLAQQLRDIT